MTTSGPLRVALTGGAGSGKSAVAARLQAHGITVVDTDRIAREVVEPGTEGLAAIIESFGEGVLGPDGRLDRRRMRQRLLEDPDARQLLESLLHPRIMQRLDEKLAGASGPYAVAEIPLLAESGQGDGFDCIVSVEAPRSERIARLTARDDISEAEARSLINAQATESERRALADIVIENDTDLATLHDRIDRLDTQLRERAAVN